MTKKRGVLKAHGGGGNPKPTHGHGGPSLSATERAALAALARQTEKAERDKKDKQLTASVIRELRKQGIIDKGATKRAKKKKYMYHSSSSSSSDSESSSDSDSSSDNRSSKKKVRKSKHKLQQLKLENAELKLKEKELTLLKESTNKVLQPTGAEGTEDRPVMTFDEWKTAPLQRPSLG